MRSRTSEHVDNGISGAKGRDGRPEFDALLRGVSRRKYDLIAAWSIDRLGRSLAHLVDFLGELQAKGVEAIGSAVLRDIMERDARDRDRFVAPLEPARDALVLDTSDLDADAVFAAALDFISRKFA